MTFYSEPEQAMRILKTHNALQEAKRGKYPSDTARQIMEELLPEWQATFLERNKGYGDMADELGPAAQFVDIHRKVGKLKRALWDEQDIGAEDVREVTLDLIGHCFLLIRTLEDKAVYVEDGS